MTAQGDYRIFIGAFPTGALADELQALRLTADARTAHITPPHVTLWGTAWRQGAPTAASEAHTAAQLHALAATLPPFTLHLGGIATFADRVIYLVVEPTAALLATRRTLLAAFGADKHRQFTPHLTLAMRLKPAATAALVADLRQRRWHSDRLTCAIDALQLMQRAPHDAAWRVIQRAPLGSAAGQTTGTSVG